MNNEMKLELSDSEKLARGLSGIEGETTFFENDQNSLDKMIENRRKENYDTGIQEILDKNTDYLNKLQSNAVDSEDMEIAPILSGVLIKPFEENPFQRQKVSDTGIIYDQGGRLAEFKNSDTGETEEAEQYIKVGSVVKAGPACKCVKDGDVVMWNIPSQIPVPYYGLGYVLINEQHIMCVINKGLTERFKNYGK